METKRRRGKPVIHPPIEHLETGRVFKEYTEAAESIGGSRHGVRRCCEGTQKHHHGQHFEWIMEGEDLNGRPGRNDG